MRNKKKLRVEQLDQKLKNFGNARLIVVPEKGWVHSIRTTLNMTMEQLGAKIGMTKGAMQKIEERESKGQITINKLKLVAEGLDMQLVYGFVPKNGTVDDMINAKARLLAEKIVLRTNQHMVLEDQGIYKNRIKDSIDELTFEIKREMHRSLWD